LAVKVTSKGSGISDEGCGLYLWVEVRAGGEVGNLVGVVPR